MSKKYPFSELPLCDDFMFGEVMRREPICTLFLEELLRKKIDHIVVIDRQKDLTDSYVDHGIRLDVYLRDEAGTVYNIEMQNVNSDTLEKRVRYYQSGIDRHQLEKATHYSELKDSFVIFVCAFDYFGYGYSIYEREMSLKNIPGSTYCDGSHVYFLNSKYKTGNGTAAILEFLQYLERKDDDTEYQSELVKQVKDAVQDVRHDKSKEEQYMTLSMKLEDARREGIREGIQEGRKKGIQEGRKEGEGEERKRVVRSMRESLSAAEIARLLKLSENEIEDILKS